MMSLLLALGLGFEPMDSERLPARRVSDIARKVIVSMKPDLQGVRPSILLTMRPEPTPLGAIRYADGRCLMVINQDEAAWGQWGRFLNAQNTAQWDALIAASVAHEMGHCLKEAVDWTSAEYGSHVGLSGLGTQSKTDAYTLKFELFADTTALIYAHEQWGAQSRQFAQTLLNSRARFADCDPNHNTAPYLQEVMKQDLSRRPNETLGMAVSRVLSNVLKASR
jgi:hypothetical protein